MKKVTTSKKTDKRRTRREIILLMTGMELSAIVKVERQETSEKSPFRTSIYCKALDSFGIVYDLQLKFSSEKKRQNKKILTDLKEDSIHLVKGQYCVFKRDFIGLLIDPKYMPLPPDLSEEDVRETFEVNLRYKREAKIEGIVSKGSFCLPHIVFNPKK